MKTFDRMAPFYDRFMAQMNLYQSATLISWLNLKGREKILDLGGGTGYNSHRLASHCKEVFLLDESQAMLNKAAQYKSFTCIRGSAIDTPFENNTFDAVVVSDLFHHIKDQSKLIHEIRRVLKPSGYLMLQDFVTGHPLTYFLQLFEFFLFGFVYFRSSRQIKSIITGQGLQLEREEQQKHLLFQLWKNPL